jgi:hypothetical protein
MTMQMPLPSAHSRIHCVPCQMMYGCDLAVGAGTLSEHAEHANAYWSGHGTQFHNCARGMHRMHIEAMMAEYNAAIRDGQPQRLVDRLLTSLKQLQLADVTLRKALAALTPADRVRLGTPEKVAAEIAEHRRLAAAKPDTGKHLSQVELLNKRASLRAVEGVLALVDLVVKVKDEDTPAFERRQNATFAEAMAASTDALHTCKRRHAKTLAQVRSAASKLATEVAELEKGYVPSAGLDVGKQIVELVRGWRVLASELQAVNDNKRVRSGE